MAQKDWQGKDVFIFIIVCRLMRERFSGSKPRSAQNRLNVEEECPSHQECDFGKYAKCNNLTKELKIFSIVTCI